MEYKFTSADFEKEVLQSDKDVYKRQPLYRGHGKALCGTD